MRSYHRLLRGLGGGVLVLAVALVGCHGVVGMVSGTVTYKNCPVPGGCVTFYNLDDNGRVVSSTSAPLDENGNYSLGVPTGPVKITVQGPPVVTAAPAAEKGGGGKATAKAGEKLASKEAPGLVPAQYGKVEKSNLLYRVIPCHQQHDISLK